MKICSVVAIVASLTITYLANECLFIMDVYVNGTVISDIGDGFISYGIRLKGFTISYPIIGMVHDFRLF